ncbi:hypothetical protein, partial [Piscinibacter sp.]|uniref:hypothetical protein n=1 Tax=Piscinibacter sp. TaxID=1903157 RepID=UPI002C784D19
MSASIQEPPPFSAGADWLLPLLDAATPRTVARATIDATRAVSGCGDACVVWGLDALGMPSVEPDPRHPGTIDQVLAQADRDLIAQVTAGRQPRLGTGERPRLA